MPVVGCRGLAVPVPLPSATTCMWTGLKPQPSWKRTLRRPMRSQSRACLRRRGFVAPCGLIEPEFDGNGCKHRVHLGSLVNGLVCPVHLGWGPGLGHVVKLRPSLVCWHHPLCSTDTGGEAPRTICGKVTMRHGSLWPGTNFTRCIPWHARGACPSVCRLHRPHVASLLHV